MIAAETSEGVGNPLGEAALTLRSILTDKSWTDGALKQLSKEELKAKLSELQRPGVSFDEAYDEAFGEGGEELRHVDGELQAPKQRVGGFVVLEVLGKMVGNLMAFKVGAPACYPEQHHPD